MLSFGGLDPETNQLLSLLIEEHKKTLTPEDRVKFENDLDAINSWLEEKAADREKIKARQKLAKELMEEFLGQK